MEIGKMEALGEEAGWKREDEGGQAMESLGTEAREERLGAREERLGAKEERLGAREERLGAKEERLGAREERLGAKEERLEAKERVEYRKEKRSFFIKSCTKRAKSRFFVTNNVKNVTF